MRSRGDYKTQLPTGPGSRERGQYRGPAPNDTSYEEGTPIPVRPIDWFMASLPARYLRPYERVYRDVFTNSGTNTIATPSPDGITVEVPSGTSLIAFRYHFYAEAPALGNRLSLLEAHELFGLVQLDFLVGGSSPVSTEIVDAGVARNGYPFITNDLTYWSPSPVFIHGKTMLQFNYTVLTAPSFPITNIGFALGGFKIASSLFDKLVPRSYSEDE